MFKKLTTILATLVFTQLALAQENFSDSLATEVESLDSVLASSTTLSTSKDASEWYLKNLWFRLRPKAAFDVEIAKLSVILEVELLFQRANPEGTVPYKP